MDERQQWGPSEANSAGAALDTSLPEKLRIPLTVARSPLDVAKMLVQYARGEASKTDTTAIFYISILSALPREEEKVTLGKVLQ